MAANGMPLPQERLIDVDRNGIARPTRAYYLFWQRLADAAAAGGGISPAQFRELLIYLGSADGTIDGLPPSAGGQYMPLSRNVLGDYSVESNGILSQGNVSITLVGDVFEPLPTSYYGTGPVGERGWRTIASAFLPGPGITLTEDGGGSGVVTVALAELADAGGGALLKFARDEYGRVAGTSAATTDDLTEGVTNLYFTDARAVAALETTGPDYLQLLLDEYNP